MLFIAILCRNVTSKKQRVTFCILILAEMCYLCTRKFKLLMNRLMRIKTMYWGKPLLLSVLFVFLGKFALKCAAWEGMKMPPLHIEGRYLVDDKGKIGRAHV